MLIGLTATLAGAAPPPEQADLTGTWALHLSVITKNKVPIVGHLRSTSETFALARLTEQDGELVVEHTVCGAAVAGGFVKTRLPAAYLANVPVKTYAASTAPDDTGLRFEADLGVFHVGYDASCAEVPTDAADPCVTDWDGDGVPGATLQVKIPLYTWTDVHVCQRNHLVLKGLAATSDRVEGDIEVLDLENSVIGASRSIFARSPTSVVDPGASHFVLTRLAVDATCEQVLASSAR